MKTLKLLILASLAAVAIGCDKNGGGGGAVAAVPVNQTSAVCNGWYTMGNQAQPQNQYGYGYGYGYGYNSGMQYQVYCYAMPSYGYGYGYGYNNGYNNGQQATRSNCAGYTLTDMTTGQQVTCQ